MKKSSFLILFLIFNSLVYGQSTEFLLQADIEKAQKKIRIVSTNIDAPAQNKTISDIQLDYHFIGKSGNIFGVLYSSQKCLTYDQSSEALLATFRADPLEYPSVQSNGSLISAYSLDNGDTWTSKISLDPDPTDFAPRYPSGIIYNPDQYSNIEDAYTVVAGPSHVDGTWSYDYFGVAKLNETNHSYFLHDTEDYIVNHFSLTVADDIVHFFGNNFDESGGTEYNFEMVHYKGSTNNPENGFTWEVNAIIPDWLHNDQEGYDYVKENIWSAWSKDGAIGYMWQVGITNETVDHGAYQPVVYYTENQGDTWVPIGLYLEDFGVLPDILPPWLDDNGNEGAVLPTFDFEGFRYREIPGVVDSDGNLHLIGSVYGSSTESVEDDDYGIQITNDKLGGHVFDFIINQDGILNIVFIDGLDNNSPSNYIFSGTKWGHRIQTSKSIDEKKIFVVWNEDISSTNGILTHPDIFAWGLDTETNQSTNVVNFTANDPNSGSFYFDFVSDISYLDSDFNHIPISTSLTQDEFDNQDEWEPITHTYIHGIGFSNGEFQNPIPPVLMVSPNNRNVSSDAGTTTYSLTSNTSWTVSESESWLSVDQGSGTNNATLIVSFEANTSEERIAEIIISADGLPDKTVYLTQAEYIPPFVTVTPSNRNVDYTAGNTSFSISSNTTWAVSEDASWLTVSPVSGEGDGLIIASYASNNSDERVAIITISGEGVSNQQVTVTQEETPPPFININPNNQSVDNGTGSVSYSIVSNTSWTIVEEEDWLSISPDSGSGNGTISVNYNSNNGDLRIGEIFATNGSDISTSATLTQSETPSLPPPTNFNVDKLGYATWEEPNVIINFPLWMRYDDGVNIQTIGTIGGGYIEPAVKWDPVQLVGYNGAIIKRVKLFLGNLVDSELTVRVYQGEQGDLIYEQEVENPNAWSWSTIDLDEDIVIDSDQAIWVGYKITHYSNQYPAGAAAPVENPNSDLVKYNGGGWTHLKPYLNYSWNLAAYVEDENGKILELPNQNVWAEDHFELPGENELVLSENPSITKDTDLDLNEFIYYNFYLDGEYLGNTEGKNWQISSLLAGESYIAGVSAVFDEGESGIITKEFYYLPPPRNLSVTNEGTADWDIPTKGNKQVYFSEDFNEGMPNGWEIISDGSTELTWIVVDELEGASLDGTSFAIANSDAAGAGSIMDEMLISPTIDASGTQSLMLRWDQNYNSWDGHDIFYVKVFDGTDWVLVYSQNWDDPAWPESVTNSVEVTQYYNEDLQVAFHYITNDWAWWTAIDNVQVYEGQSIEYNVLLNDEFIATTNLSGWDYQNLQDGQTYISGVAANYENGISDTIEYEFIYFSDYFYIGVAPPSREVSYLAGQTSFTITSNDTWQASTNEDWIHFTAAYGEGDGYLMITYDQNNSAARSGIIELEGINGGDLVQVTVLQDGINDFLPPRNLRVSSYGLALWDEPDGDLSDLVGYNVYLDGETYTSTLDLYRQFLTLIPNQTYVAGVQAVYNNQNLSAIIESEFTYTSEDDLLVSPQDLFVDENVGSVKFNVFSNTYWSISSEASWITISPSGGSFDEEITLFYSANEGEQRIAQIEVSGIGFESQSLFLTQTGTTTLNTQLSITPSNLDIDSGNDFSTQVKISDIADLVDFEFEILFNSSILNLSESNITEFITSSGRTISTEINSIDNEYGLLEVYITTSGEGIAGVDGSGDLVELNWSVISNEANEITTGILIKNVVLKNTLGASINHLSNDAIIIINPSSIAHLEHVTFMVIPNPTTGKFRIEMSNFIGDYKVDIFNSLGAFIKRIDFKQTENNDPEIDLEFLPSGMYFIKVHNKDFSKGSKLMIE